MINGQVKGKAFERFVANWLTAKLGAKFQRVPQSGAMASGQNLEDSRFQGDVFSEDEKFKNWVIECKISGKPITLEKLLSEDGIVNKWWEQTVTEAKGKTPILFFRYNGSPLFLCLDSNWYVSTARQLVVGSGYKCVRITRDLIGANSFDVFMIKESKKSTSLLSVTTKKEVKV